MKYSYEFNFGESPAFLYDAWFKKKMFPVLVVCVIFFPLCFFLLEGIFRIVLPSIALGALVIFFGVYISRRRLAKKRVSGITNPVFQYEINDHGIRYENEFGNGTIKWGFKGKIVSTARFLMIESGEMGLLPIPVDAPKEVIDFVKNKLAS